MTDNRLFSPPGVVAMGNGLSSRMSRPNLSAFFSQNGHLLTSSDLDQRSAKFGSVSNSSE